MPRRSRRIASRQAELGRKRKKKGGPSAPEQMARKRAAEGAAEAPSAAEAPRAPEAHEEEASATPAPAAAPRQATRPTRGRARVGQRAAFSTGARIQLKGDLLRIAAISALMFVILGVLTVVLR